TGSFLKMAGEVEADETAIGGLAKNMHAAKRREKIHGRGSVGKAVVMGLLERQTGKVKAKPIPDTQQGTLHAEVKATVQPGAAVYTDSHGGDKGLNADDAHHCANNAAHKG